MPLPANFAQLSGEWKGTKRLYLSGESGPELRSASRMTIAKVAREALLMCVYTWKYEGLPHEGVLLLCYDEKANVASAAWGDSWHMNARLMQCTGAIEGANKFLVRGSYAAPPGPDWGWTIEVGVRDVNAIEIVMENISPEGEKYLAVRADFARAG